MEDLELQYIIDKEGNRWGVIVLMKDWEKLQQEFNEFLKYKAFKSSLKSALKEVEDIKNNKVKPVTAKEFLNEL